MNTSDFRFLLGYTLPYRAMLAFCVLLMVAENGMALAVPWLGGNSQRVCSRMRHPLSRESCCWHCSRRRRC